MVKKYLLVVAGFSLRYFVVAVAIGFILCANVEGATRTWGGGEDNNWSTPANWSDNTLPDTTDDVVFDGISTKNCNIDSTVTVASISINSGYTGIITQNDSVNVTVSGDFTQADGAYTIGVSKGEYSFPETLTVNGTYTMSGGSSDSYYTGSLVLNGNATFSAVIELFDLSCSAGSNATTITGDRVAVIALNSITIGTGTVTGTGRLRVNDGAVLNNSGTIDCITTYNSYGSIFAVYPGNYAALEVTGQQSSAKGILEGNITCTSLKINHNIQPPDTSTLDTNGYSITASSIDLSGGVGGTLKCNGSAINVSGNVYVESGTGKIINADSSTWNIGGTLTNNGTLNVGTSTMKIMKK